jgi:hypothetical protein
LAVPRESDLVFMFCAPGLVFGRTEGVGSRLHVFGGDEGVRSCINVLRARTCFLLYRGLRVPISCFVLLDLFSAVPRASCPVLMYCESGHVFCGTEGVLSLFHVLRARSRFRRYRVRRVLFSCFARSYSFSTVPSVSGPVFMFCALGLIFGCTEGVRSRFHVLRSQTRFRRYQGRRVPF